MVEPALPPGMSRETRIRRDAGGRWFDGDDPITHPNLVRAFDSWIDVADDGRYCLRNSIHWVYVAIDGAPVRVLSASLRDGDAWLTLSDGRTERLEPRTLRQGRDGALYCQVRDGRLAARFVSSAAMELEPVIDEDEDGVLLQLGGESIRPPVVEDPVGLRAVDGAAAGR